MKKKILISLDEDVVEILEKGTKDLGINKSQMITRLIKDNVENRLSKYIVRDIENLLYYLILQNNNFTKLDKSQILDKLDFIRKETKTIKSVKSLLLKTEREKKKTELKTFWNKILTLLEPSNFYNQIGFKNGKIDQVKTKEFLKELYKIIKENPKLWE